MTKSWIWFLVGAALAVSDLSMPARAQSNLAYAVEFNTSNNRFGTINLMNGSFTEIASLGSTVYNDIAYAPDGTLFGLANNGSSLVKFEPTSGAVTTVASLNMPGLESIAFRPSDGVLFGATGTGLCSIDPVTGQTTYLGDYGAPYNLNLAQNIRFDSDGNLYLSNTGNNTDLYRVNTQNGSATFVGDITGYANLILQNGGQYVYGVSIPSINNAGGTNVLVSFNLGSLVDGGTNADGSLHQIPVTMVGAGGQFPVNFNFSGNVPNPLPPTVPDAGVISIAAQPDRSMAISLSGSANQTYVIQASSDLKHWTSISTNLTDANGRFTMPDPNRKNYSSFFYRGVVPQ